MYLTLLIKQGEIMKTAEKTLQKMGLYRPDSVYSVLTSELLNVKSRSKKSWIRIILETLQSTQAVITKIETHKEFTRTYYAG